MKRVEASGDDWQLKWVEADWTTGSEVGGSVSKQIGHEAREVCGSVSKQIGREAHRALTRRRAVGSADDGKSSARLRFCVVALRKGER